MRFLASIALILMFRLMNLRLKLDRGYRRLICPPGRDENWAVKIAIRTPDGGLALAADIRDGRVQVRRGIPAKPDVTLTFRDTRAALALLTRSPSQVLEMLLTGELVFSGNLSDVARLSFMLSSLLPRRRRPRARTRIDKLPEAGRSLPMQRCDAVEFLEDPGLSQYTLRDFPRLEKFKHAFFSAFPAMCTERARLYTEYVRKTGFENSSPLARQAGAFSHVMIGRKPLIREGDLLAGTSTTKDVGVIVYPECGGVTIWPELKTMQARKLNPYLIDGEDERILNEDVFPFWSDRNVREWARKEGGNPLSLQLDERFVLYFQWKTQAISHTIADFPKVLGDGLQKIRDKAIARAATPDAAKKEFYKAMATTLDSVMVYAANLAHEAHAQAERERDPTRALELREIARICEKVPRFPASTLHEALQSIWIVWIACHMENTNAGLSIGTLDHWLQPYFAADLARISDHATREAYVKRAIELTGCFFLRCTDHLPQVADLGNKLFGGSSSDQVVTVGGVTPDGGNGVNDMTFIILKVAEMLGLRDPNLNARYHEGVNSEAYLKRLCEVNLLTGATPSIHNDRAVIEVLRDQGMREEHARDWSATGCVEPTSCGRHYGHTNCMMFNLVSPLEMALHDGFHPLVGEQLGPHTGDPRTFTTFEQVFDTYCAQLKWQIKTAVEANNLLGRAHQFVRPTPFLSALIDGPMEKGIDLVQGGALYNSSGSGNVGLVDVVDSLLALKDVIFDSKRCDMATFLKALDANFVGYETLHAWLENRAPKVGTGNPKAAELGTRVIRVCHETFRAQPHYRGGHYNSGFWSMSNHVAFGMMTGALPSGRRAGKAFTPGLTPGPSPHASLTEHIHDVAALDHHLMPNNVAFNIKILPSADDTQDRSTGLMTAYARTYFQEGGMQLQFNVVSSETLRDARAHPERYPTLMVRISGYNAYFNDLNDDMKIELIERAEHRLSG